MIRLNHSFCIKFFYTYLIFTFITGINSNQNNAVKSYKNAQLLRVSKYSNEIKTNNLIENLEINYDVILWKFGENYVDIIANEFNLNKVKNYLDYLNINYEVVIKNIQDEIDNEQQKHKISKRSINSSSLSMDWMQYHSYETINEFLENMKHKYPSLVEIIDVGKSVEGRELRLLQISSNSNTANNNSKLWLDGGIHAREWISPAVTTYIANELLKNWDILPSYITNKTWYIMFLINPDGYEYSRNYDRMWRKNRRKNLNSDCYGVDLNRNFNIDWRSGSQSRSQCSIIYRGRKPFSEPETLAIAKFIRTNQYNLKAFLTFHSYGQYILYPWGFQRTQVLDHARLQQVGNEAALKIRNITGNIYRSSQSHILGLISGASDDWSRHIIGVKYAYTIELQDTGLNGFLLPEKKIISAGAEGLAIAETIASAISSDEANESESVWEKK